METNREVKIAIIVGLIMITGCIVAFIIAKNKNNPEVTMDLHVYKHIELADGTNGKYYECNVPTESLVKINSEFKRIMNLKDANKVKDLNANLEGTYKIATGSNFIAFDATGSNYVYRSDTTAIYDYNSEIYKEVATHCAYITRDSVQRAENQNTEQEEQKEEEKETKKETKNDTSSKKKSSSTKKSSKK